MAGKAEAQQEIALPELESVSEAQVENQPASRGDLSLNLESPSIELSESRPTAAPPLPEMPPLPPPAARPPAPPSAFDDEKTDPGLAPRPTHTPPPSATRILNRSALTPPPPPKPPAPVNRTPPPPASPRFPPVELATSTPNAETEPPPQTRLPELGALEPLMRDPEITEVMVNDLRSVMIEKGGMLGFSGLRIQALDELNRIVRNILDSTGRVLTPDSPYVDVMLPDGSRVNIVAPPLTKTGPCITIRKFPTRSYTLDDLTRLGMLDLRMSQFLKACVVGRMNILVCGGTGTGKTTVLNALCGMIPKNERLVAIEDVPELRIAHANSVSMQTKPQTPGSPAIQARELVANALRMRPDRIIVGECRRAEAFDMLQAMNTGHQGSMTSLHANSPRDGLHRLETLCLLAGADLPLLAIRKQMVSALDLIVQIRRFKTGKRRIVAIAEVTGIEGETITLQDIFQFKSAVGSAQPDAGEYSCTGLVPTFLDRLRENGVDVPRGFFA
jgi:pilus assembly protein CpaF